MFYVNRPERACKAIIRPATQRELSNYEKRKLASIEENAQENRIESLSINGKRIDPVDKEVNIALGDMAFKRAVSPEDLSTDELFFIKCELD
jgi:hypothetical protein